MRRGAQLSDCGRYRYSLWRTWMPELPTMTFVMLNPSTADAERDDPTVRRCIGFAQREGCGEIVVVNLFSFRTPSPRALADAISAGIWPWGPQHDEVMRRALAHARDARHRLVAAWGASPLADRAVAKMPQDLRMWCLGLTKSGAPRHPLYVRRDQMLWPFELAGSAVAG